MKVGDGTIVISWVIFWLVVVCCLALLCGEAKGQAKGLLTSDQMDSIKADTVPWTGDTGIAAGNLILSVPDCPGDRDTNYWECKSITQGPNGYVAVPRWRWSRIPGRWTVNPVEVCDTVWEWREKRQEVRFE